MCSAWSRELLFARNPSSVSRPQPSIAIFLGGHCSLDFMVGDFTKIKDILLEVTFFPASDSVCSY